ncbi:MAG: amidohydrolase [Anaerolineae bacterium]|nr:amidohydrolase [Anaerolineae bacterium]
MTYLDRARALHNRLVAIRRDLHAHPELFFQEVRTAQRIVEILRELGIEAQTGIARTGVVAYIGNGTPRVGLRADMDALPILEANDVPYKSQNPGVMHACGHDAHVTCLLGAAMLLHEDAQRGALRGSVKLLFQPAEENCGADGKSGGRLMVEAGALDDVDAVFGLHVASMLPSGEIYVRAGAFMAAVDTFEAEIIGRGGHGAYPHQALDSIWLAAQVINAIYGIVARRMDPTRHGLISVCSIHAGTTTNVIPDAVKISGTIRSFDETTRALLHRELEHAFALARTWGGDYKWKLIDGYPATVNDARMAELVRAVAREVVGADKVKEAELQMGAEDFSFMARAKPAAFFNLGAKKDTLDRPHHNPMFDIDESVLPIGAAMLAATAQRFLNLDWVVIKK